MKITMKYFLGATALVSVVSPLEAFLAPPRFGIRRPRSSEWLSKATGDESTQVLSEAVYIESQTIIRAPLKFVGPYPALSLRFPDLATSSQRSRNVTGISLDFVLDTAANTNTIATRVTEELQLDVVGKTLPGVASSGVILGADTFLLGDAQLEGIEGDPFIFMQNLTASALPVAGPASAGLLSLAFFYCFEGGVEFDWGSQVMEDGILKNPPSVTFYGEDDDNMKQRLQSMSRVPLQPIPITQLPSVTIKVNGVEMKALLDTGSPITVLNAQAAKLAGIETVQLPEKFQQTSNPFAVMANRFKEAKETAQAASRGDILTIAAQGGQVNLLKSTSKAHVILVGDDDDVSFGESNFYVGEIPGLAALNGIGVESPPAVVLGMDVLRTRPKMLFRARDNEVYF
jgi:hypothetical protein